jgi:hypothetical protein
MSAEDLRARVLAAAKNEPSPPREATVVHTRRAGQAATVVTLLVFLGIGGMHLHARPEGLVMGSAVGWGLVAVVATWVAAGRTRSMLGLPRAWRLGAALATPLALGAVWFAVAPPLGELTVPHAVSIDLLCFGFALALGLAPLAAFFVVRREGDPVDPVTTGAALGAAAGAWGALLIDLHCEMSDPRHVLVGHVLPTVVMALLGGALGARLLAVRPSRR